MPVEILTREEVERVIEEKLKRLMAARPPALSGDEALKKKVVELESSILELKNKISLLSASATGTKPTVTEPLVETLKAELGALEGLLEIRGEGELVILRPKRYLGSQRFRTAIEVVRKHGGNWVPDRRLFIIRKG